MEYGKNFWCLDDKLRRLPELVYPKLEPFRYSCDCSRGFWLLENYAIEFMFRGVWWRMMIAGDMVGPLRFDFDGASIPQWAWSLVGDTIALDILIAALFHDILFCVHLPDWPFRETNDLFYLLQKACGASKPKMRVTHQAVRAVGRYRWPKTDAEIEKYRPMFVAYPFTPALA